MLACYMDGRPLRDIKARMRLGNQISEMKWKMNTVIILGLTQRLTDEVKVTDEHRNHQYGNARN